MINMFEMLSQAQNGAAMENLSRQFGLHPDQTRQAVEALMPAFNEGMRRQAQSLEAMQDFFGKLGSGSFERFFEQPESTESDEAREHGNDVLSQMFGSKAVSRAVSDQAAAMTGIGTEMYRQMLPVIASMMMGGLARQGANTNPMQQMMQQMMGAGASASNPMQQMMEQMMRAGTAGANPMAEMMQEMFASMLGGTDAGKKKGSGFDPAEIVDALFTAGRKTQDANAEAMGRIFEQFMGGRR